LEDGLVDGDGDVQRSAVGIGDHVA
jgi:hypothetical protein